MTSSYQSILGPLGYRVIPATDGYWDFAIECPGLRVIPCRLRLKMDAERFYLPKPRLGDTGRYLLCVAGAFYWTGCVSDLEADCFGETFVDRSALVPLGAPDYRRKPEYQVYPR
jgi:hypothetical protein